jgi:hypothetical protein
MMTDNPPNTKRRRFQFSIRTMLIVFLVGALMLGLARDYGWKLVWRLGLDPAFNNNQSWRPSDIRSTPVSPMPGVSPELPEDWTDYRVASLRMSLPRGMAVRKVGEHLKLIVLETADRSVIVILPTDNTDVLKARTDFVSKSPSARELSQAELQVAVYEAGWDDFRWSMSHEEFLWHRWLLTTGQVFRHVVPVDRLEIRFRDDIAGLLIICDGRAFFEWSSAEGATAGTLVFIQEPGPLDADWVRRVCQSLEFSGQCRPEGISEAELLELIGPIDED